MRVLVVAGIGAFSLVMPLTLVICVVLAIVATSYRQTIRAYPNGASSYIVASRQPRRACWAGRGRRPAHRLHADGCRLRLSWRGRHHLDRAGAVGLEDLDGSRDRRAADGRQPARRPRVGDDLHGADLSLPGGRAGHDRLRAGWRWRPVSYRPTRRRPSGSPPRKAGGIGVLGLLLVLRAFSSGAVALTGVEAVSDGVPAFKPPEWRNARTTLTWAAVLFATLFIGISFLVSSLGILPDPAEEQTVLSILARHLTGDGPFLVLVQISTALLLTLAANTSFADFPRLSSFLARDGYMPRQFGFRGDRLAFTTGIVALAAVAIAAAVVLRGVGHGADPPLHAGRVRGVHAVPGRDGQALVEPPGARLASRPRHQRAGSCNDRPDRR